jgi:hypothetical protein
MMNIDEMTDQEKSVALARAMGWGVSYEGRFGIESDVIHVIDEDGYHSSTIDLYAGPMETAWRVLNWAEGQDFWHRHFRTGSESDSLAPFEWAVIRRKPPADAQRAWLDKVLELAIEAGLIPD